MKYQDIKNHILSPVKTDATCVGLAFAVEGLGKCWPTTHIIKCVLRKYKVLNEDIDVTLLDVTERRICIPSI